MTATTPPLAPSITLPAVVIYDGNCNFCVTFVKLLEQWDQGQRFVYVPMQDEATLAQWHITPAACQAGMILLDPAHPQAYVQGSAAAEEITRLLPGGNGLIAAYRNWATLKGLGDATYATLRDHRYAWFGGRSQTYRSPYPAPACGGNCSPITAVSSGPDQPSPSPTSPQPFDDELPPE
ncbi:DCC1-like thiol-disulfide oxidoreductase family protein [Thermosynechococcaceae cyanobacterium BACA0444]|uniref:DCC1-like thiol-disulfide oxidoreductase family protein n=1 Tax=Pseudocalidococcus azoricus BACA0444 TaxID=2918990 RepID=A0AAE4FTM6_9CYAN|nr:DCC1-like thiol-disulfide oxidoreductase family protein [Pseudocalidococcus azoricus]MDS3861352.1 DCC1-like thiol-disulfide oxidoreductase family protein [Pseudocalidococcus azoricus BACA0444]